jgi:hypothetical protein
MGALEVEDDYNVLLVVGSFNHVNYGEEMPLASVIERIHG